MTIPNRHPFPSYVPSCAIVVRQSVILHCDRRTPKRTRRKHENDTNNRLRAHIMRLQRAIGIRPTPKPAPAESYPRLPQRQMLKHPHARCGIGLKWNRSVKYNEEICGQVLAHARTAPEGSRMPPRHPTWWGLIGDGCLSHPIFTYQTPAARSSRESCGAGSRGRQRAKKKTAKI